MREAAESGNGLEVLLRRAGRHFHVERVEQVHRVGLVVAVLAVLERDIELKIRWTRFKPRSNPRVELACAGARCAPNRSSNSASNAGVERNLVKRVPGHRARLRVGGVGPRRSPEDVPGILVQENDQGEAARGRGHPRVELAGAGAAVRVRESLL